MDKLAINAEESRWLGNNLPYYDTYIKRCVQAEKKIIGMSKIYNYIDQKGIPFKKLASFSIRIQEDDILNRLKIESDETTDRIINKGELIISTHNHPNVKAPDFPNKFKLDKKPKKKLLLIG
ncbi:hypothetical protein [Aquimarina brevivitae]|nr:hypothetical protein [Aquimarina brevivitae]